MHILSLGRGCQLASKAQCFHSLPKHEAPLCALKATAALLYCSTMSALAKKQVISGRYFLVRVLQSLRVFSVWVGSVGLLRKLETCLLLKQNNKFEQIIFIVIGSGVVWSNLSFVFLEDCSRGDALQSQIM